MKKIETPAPFHGLLLIDKPSGCTSHDVVARVRRALRMKGVGHAGTLDPLASGLLVLLVGEATKISDYILNGDKGYEVTVRLGVVTDTMDVMGEVLSEAPAEQLAQVSDAQLNEAILQLTGELELAVPLHSAVKIQGRKLYEYARADQEVAAPMRKMNFYDVRILGRSGTEVRVALRCSKGSFIRAWANELGRKLGCGGTVSQLRRLFSSPYEVENAISLSDLEERWAAQPAGALSASDIQKPEAILGSAWVPLKATLPGFRTLMVQGQDEYLMRHGQISKNLQVKLLSFVVGGEKLPAVKVVSSEELNLLSVLLAENGEFYRIKRVFNQV
jgi:tRNA pseudouridine55 synthase